MIVVIGWSAFRRLLEFLAVDPIAVDHGRRFDGMTAIEFEGREYIWSGKVLEGSAWLGEKMPAWVSGSSDDDPPATELRALSDVAAEIGGAFQRFYESSTARSAPGVG